MSNSSSLPRPRQVSLAAGLIMGGSVVVVLAAFDRVARLRTIETRESVQEFLSGPPGDGLGLTVPGALTALHAVSMVAAGCATAAAILGYHVLKRSRSARLGLAVLALPLFVSGFAAGGIVSSMVAVSAVLLWFQPARDWFNGIKPRPAPDLDPRPPPRTGPPLPTQGFGVPPAAPTAIAPRPRAVVWACVLTWVCAGMAILLMGVAALVLTTQPQLVLDELNRSNPELAEQGITERLIRTTTYLTAAVTVVWGSLAVWLAVLVFRGRDWARLALIGSAVGAGLVFLLVSFGSWPMVLPAAICAVVFSLLLRPEVRAWSGRADGGARGPMHP